MKPLLAAILLFSIPCFAQQGNPMPGMPMRQPQQPMQIPGDMEAPTPHNPAAQKETRSMQSSEQEQQGGTATRPGPASDAASLAQDTFTLQEREAPGIHTGASLPVPALLNEVAARAPLGLDAFLAMARRSNPTLAQAQAAVQRSSQQARQAGLVPNPSIGYSGDHIRGGSYHGGEEGAFVEQDIVLGGKLGLRRDIYEQEARANQIGVEEQQLRIGDTVAQAFYQALAAQAGVVVHQRMLKVALDASETAHQFSNVGQADAPDVLQSEVEAEQAQVDFVDAQRDYLQKFQALAADAGAFNLAAAPLQGELENPPTLDAEQQVAAIVAQSPQVRRAQQAVAVAQARLKSARREPIPNLSIKAGEWYSGEDLGSTAQQAGPMSFVEAGVNLPLWNRNQGNIGAAKAEVELAQAEVTRTRLILKRQAEMLAQNYLSAQFTAQRYRTELLPRARRAYQLYVMKYQQMAQAYPQVLLSQRTLFQLQAGYLHALQEEWTAALALQNFTLTDGLGPLMLQGAASTAINLPDGGGSE